MTPYLPYPAAFLVASSMSTVTITVASTETEMTASGGSYDFSDDPEENDKVPDCRACKNKRVLPSGRMLHGRPVMVDCRSCSVHKNNRQGRRARKE
jgi:hypothetical protein